MISWNKDDGFVFKTTEPDVHSSGTPFTNFLEAIAAVHTLAFSELVWPQVPSVTGFDKAVKTPLPPTLTVAADGELVITWPTTTDFGNLKGVPAKVTEKLKLAGITATTDVLVPSNLRCIDLTTVQAKP